MRRGLFRSGGGGSETRRIYLMPQGFARVLAEKFIWELSVLSRVVYIMKYYIRGVDVRARAARAAGGGRRLVDVCRARERWRGDLPLRSPRGSHTFSLCKTLRLTANTPRLRLAESPAVKYGRPVYLSPDHLFERASKSKSSVSIVNTPLVITRAQPLAYI